MKREFIPMSGLYDMNIGALRMYYAQRPTPKPENEVKNVVFRCDVVKDKDILEALKDVKNKSDYIKSLLRRALQEENAEKEDAAGNKFAFASTNETIMKLQEELEKLKNSDDGEKENGKSENGEKQNG